MKTQTKSSVFKLFDHHQRRCFLPVEEWKRLIAVLEDAPDSDRYLVLTLLRTGMRSIEIARFRPKDIRLGRMGLSIINAKKRKDNATNKVPKNKQTRFIEIESAYLQALATFAASIPLDKPIWPLSRWTIRRIVQHYMSQAGIPHPRNTVRALRHSFATNARRKNVKLEKIQSWMGHEDIKTTMGYIDADEDPHTRLAAETMWH